ncbi:kinase-like domain-containing protein [Glomus cerebriforme]|uniref:Kinase-like domain-containing protein n=1 Tax=Glomus cerebriforme TaxID=658196 RepID=A0A397SVT6_9GLOM|nr:kinase-like domain-containing protein [Glomus cerebriforme]
MNNPAPKKKLVKRVNKGFDDALGSIEPTINTAQAICAGVEAAAHVAVPFANFLPLIGEVAKICTEIADIYNSAEHNKRICGVMLDRVQVAETSVKNLKNRREENEDFFSEGNYINLQKLVTVIGKIRKFLAEISQLKGLYKYVQAKNIEKTAIDLNREFDSTIQLLEFALMIDFNARADIDNKKIRTDIEELSEYLQHIEGGLTDTNKNVSEVVVQLNALNNTMNQYINGKQVDEDIFQNELLPYTDFDETEGPTKKVRKFKRIKNGINDFVALQLVADESSKEDDKNNIKNQVTILRKLEECRNIIQFFGLTTSDGNKWYLVTEWAEHGNLREYYKEFGPLDVDLKLLFALDIARGLNFLRAVEIVHRDIRAENILVTDHRVAKIANFSSSRAVTDVTKNHKTTLECVRYCAPEKLGSRSQSKYDTKSEIYSFGILLWEIAEERVPYENHNDIVTITDLVYEKKYREPFSESSPLPKQYQEIAKKAVDPDPAYRPSFTKIFTVLQDLHMQKNKPPPSPRFGASKPRTIRRQDTIDSFELSKDEEEDIMIVPDFAEFNYMTVDEAAKHHKLPEGKRDLELAYKCFDAYAELGDMKAKYFKAYYIQQGYAERDMDKNEKDKLIADLFKEVADSGDEYPEAQLRYGNCLVKGIGVKKSLKEAALYFTKAAENGQVVGMFNAASLYFTGGAGKKDPKLGEKYMKLAAYKQHAQAIEYCKKNKIPL